MRTGVPPRPSLRSHTASDPGQEILRVIVDQVLSHCGKAVDRPNQTRIIMLNLHIPRNGVFACYDRNSSTDTLLDCQVQAASHAFDGPALAQGREFPLRSFNVQLGSASAVKNLDLLVDWLFHGTESQQPIYDLPR